MHIDGRFRARVLAGEFLAGSWLNLGSPITAEMAGMCGFDWVLMDHEHGPGSEMTLIAQLQAASATRAVGLVRIANNDPTRFKRVLDAGDRLRDDLRRLFRPLARMAGRHPADRDRGSGREQRGDRGARWGGRGLR